LDVTDLPLATIAVQYDDYLRLLEQESIDDVAEFIDAASTLLEIKSQLLLPRGGEEVDTVEDPRHELVQRVLEYKKYRDAASVLDEQGRVWQLRFGREANHLPSQSVDLESQPIRELELWDLVSAFGRILRDNQAAQPANIVYDDTPIQVYMQRIYEQLLRERQLLLSDLLQPGMHKSAVVAVFLAILELVRHHGVRTEQAELHGEIRILKDGSLSDRMDDAYAARTEGTAPQDPHIPAQA
jgi:segregation and condensation protein A